MVTVSAIHAIQELWVCLLSNNILQWRKSNVHSQWKIFLCKSFPRLLFNDCIMQSSIIEGATFHVHHCAVTKGEKLVNHNTCYGQHATIQILINAHLKRALGGGGSILRAWRNL